jgi:hypothetical protein
VPADRKLGHLADVIVRLRGSDYPLVTGLVADIGGKRVFLPADMVTDWNHHQLKLSSARLDLAPCPRARPGDPRGPSADEPRRKPVLELLPVGQRAKVTALLGYNPTTAGGLVGLDFIALPQDSSAQAALDTVRAARTMQLEALTIVFASMAAVSSPARPA